MFNEWSFHQYAKHALSLLCHQFMSIRFINTSTSQFPLQSLFTLSMSAIQCCCAFCPKSLAAFAAASSFDLPVYHFSSFCSGFTTL